MKTNAVRTLDRLGVRYELREYEVDPEALDAETVARKIGLPAEQVFKTLVARGDRNGVCLAVVPGTTELDEKALARVTGDRKTEVVPLKEVQPLTGYIRGGVTALACRREYPVFVDETVELFEVIAVSAGVRGTQILLAPADYLAARETMQRARREFAALMARFDAIMAPAAPGEAPAGLDATGDPLFNRLPTLLLVPSLNLNVMTGPQGLPVGVQFIGAFDTDLRLLQIGQLAAVRAGLG